VAIVMPLVIPLAHALGANAGFAPERVDTILIGVFSSLLAGSVFGDHCSPISDTTILSSMAPGSDYLGVMVGDVPTAFGVSPWISITVGIGILVGVLYLYGQPVGEPLEGEPA
jgi:Na+/H+ antiporter NhaC